MTWLNIHSSVKTDDDSDSLPQTGPGGVPGSTAAAPPVVNQGTHGSQMVPRKECGVVRKLIIAFYFPCASLRVAIDATLSACSSSTVG